MLVFPNPTVQAQDHPGSGILVVWRKEYILFLSVPVAGPDKKSIYSEEALQDSAAQVSPIDAGASLAAWGGSPLGEAVG